MQESSSKFALLSQWLRRLPACLPDCLTDSTDLSGFLALLVLARAKAEHSFGHFLRSDI